MEDKGKLKSIHAPPGHSQEGKGRVSPLRMYLQLAVLGQRIPISRISGRHRFHFFELDHLSLYGIGIRSGARFSDP